MTSSRERLLALAFVLLSARGAAQSAVPVEDPHAPAPGTQVDCLRCHEPLKEKIARSVPHKPVADGQCAACHAPHASRYPKLLNLRERALCSSCHQDQMGQFLQGSVHTPIKEGQCTVCHDVHGSANPSLLTSEGNELCFTCHDEKHQQSSLPIVHDPFATGECLDCHAAHNSPHADQLAAPARNLCQLCHPGDDAALVTAHEGIPVLGTNCTGCHEPHAATTKGLLRNVVHQPFGDGSCDLCHLLESDTPQLVRLVGGRLCAVCHADYPRKTDTVLHKPVVTGDCNACHVAHTSDHKGLLPGPVQQVCTSCHAELAQRALDSKSAHPVEDDKGSCLACHTPHSSTESHLLVSGEIRTCLACHETSKHGHPLGDDRLDPRTGKAITCVTCHDPHGTAFSMQLRGDQSRGLCVQCHSDGHASPKEAERGQRK